MKLQGARLIGKLNHLGALSGNIKPKAGIVGKVDKQAVLAGKINPVAVLAGKINQQVVLVGTMSKPVGYVDYLGEYEATPKPVAQKLYTRAKHMTDDVTIHAIPYFDVSNTSGGSTVYIGSEVE